jgi:hypothetical protein
MRLKLNVFDSNLVRKSNCHDYLLKEYINIVLLNLTEDLLIDCRLLKNSRVFFITRSLQRQKIYEYSYEKI